MRLTDAELTVIGSHAQFDLEGPTADRVVKELIESRAQVMTLRAALLGLRDAVDDHCEGIAEEGALERRCKEADRLLYSAEALEGQT